LRQVNVDPGITALTLSRNALAQISVSGTSSAADNRASAELLLRSAINGTDRQTDGQWTPDRYHSKIVHLCFIQKFYTQFTV